MNFNALIPELVVTDLPRSMAFYQDALGFREVFARPEEGFHFLERNGAQIMILAAGEGRWMAHGESPLGNGINLAIALPAFPVGWVDSLRPNWFVAPFEHEYETADGRVRVEQFVVRDPDGYLLRFLRRLPPAAAT